MKKDKRSFKFSGFSVAALSLNDDNGDRWIFLSITKRQYVVRRFEIVKRTV